MLSQSNEVSSFVFLQKPNIFHTPFNSKNTNLRGQEKCQVPEFHSVITLTMIFLPHMTYSLELLDL